MLKVGVCDDERILAERLIVSLREIFEKKGVDAGISLFLSAEKLLHASPDLGLVILGMKEGYIIDSCRFIAKPVNNEELWKAVDEVLKKKPGAELIRLFLDNHSYEIPQNKIDYAEAYNGYTIFHVGGRLFRREENLNHFDSVLDSRIFVRTSRKHIVNLGNVSSADSSEELCFPEEHIPVARRQRDAVRRKCIEYDLSYGRKR